MLGVEIQPTACYGILSPSHKVNSKYCMLSSDTIHWPQWHPTFTALSYKETFATMNVGTSTLVKVVVLCDNSLKARRSLSHQFMCHTET